MLSSKVPGSYLKKIFMIIAVKLFHRQNYFSDVSAVSVSASPEPVSYTHLRDGCFTGSISSVIPDNRHEAVGSFGQEKVVCNYCLLYTSTMVAGNAAAANADALVYDVMAAFYTACGSFMGQNFGAGNRKRVRNSYLISLAYSFGIGMILSLIHI